MNSRERRCRSLLLLVCSLAHCGLAAADDSKAPSYPFTVRVVGKGKPVLFIPGLSCSADVWNETADHFKDRYECHLLTLAGFAGVPPVKGPFLETICKGIGIYIREKKLDKPAIVGHSIGGFLTYQLGAQIPDLVGPLVAVDGVPFLSALVDPATTAEQVKKQNDEMLAMMLATPAPQFLKQQEMTLAMWIPNKKKRAPVLEWSAKSDKETVVHAMMEMTSQDLRPTISKIKSPLLLVAVPVAFFDVSQEESKKRYKAQLDNLPSANIVYALKSKHFVMFDEPQWLWTQIDEFLKKNY